MNDITYYQWIRETEKVLFTCVGGSERIMGCSKLNDWAQASASLRSDDFQDAVSEARNALSGLALQVDPHKWSCWNDEVDRISPDIDSIVTKSCDRLRKHGVDVVDDVIIRRFTSMILTCVWLESWFEVQTEQRVFEKCRSICTAGGMVCGWRNGLYPAGEWAFW